MPSLHCATSHGAQHDQASDTAHMLPDDLAQTPQESSDGPAHDIHTLLDWGIAAARRGQRQRARRYFETVLAIDRNNEDAWLWLASMTEDHNLARAMYERILVGHPSSLRAQAGLRWLDRASSKVSQPATPTWQETESTPAEQPLSADENHAGADQIEQPGEEHDDPVNGAALFIPPWEMDAVIPVPGCLALSGLAAVRTDIACAADSMSPLREQIEAPSEQAVPSGDYALLEHALPERTLPEAEHTFRDDDQPQSEERPDIHQDKDPDPNSNLSFPPPEQSAFATFEAIPTTTEQEPEVRDMSTEPTTSEPEMPPTIPESPISEPPAAFHPLKSHVRKVPSGRLFRDTAMLGMLLALIGGALALGLLVSSPSQAERVRVALGVFTETPTPTCTPTITLTPTPTSTPTTTPTLTPSPTYTPTITPTPAPTATPDWVTSKYLPLPLEEKWIEVDLSEQALTAYEGTEVVYTAIVSTGRANTPTVQGKFRILRKLDSQLMAGPGYYLPNVPWVMYFYGGFALHGAYWHDKWGTPTSHGCVNLKREDAKWLYDWADPEVPEGRTTYNATAANPGTWVLVHE